MNKTYKNKPVKNIERMFELDDELKKTVEIHIACYKQGLITCDEFINLVYETRNKFIKLYKECY